MAAPILHLPLVAIVNKSTIVTDDQVRAAVDALQKQVSNDFSTVGWPDAILFFAGASDPLPAGAWSLIVLDDTDQAGDLGYHQTDLQGVPTGFVFAKTDAQYGLSWTVTLSHELLEMLADPWIFGVAEQRRDTITSYALEVCDPVEADNLGYVIDGVRLSNFVCPAYFMDPPPAGAKFDHCGFLTAPFSLAPGGYLSARPNGAPEWGQIKARGTLAPTPRQIARQAKRSLSRTFRRTKRS